MIEISHFSKKYSSHSKYAVKDVSLVCDKGVTFLIGPNGAGKSTLLKAILALNFPTEGTVRVSTNSLFDVFENPGKARSASGFVPENPVLPKNLYLRELLEDTLSFHGINPSSSEGKKRFAFSVSSLELSGVLDKKIGSLSRGFVQRAAFAAAIIHEPENLILDEALSGLDPSQIIQVRNVIKEYGKNHTVLISTHIMQEVSALSDNIYVISKGEIKASGCEKDILEKSGTKNLEDAFLFFCKE